MSAQRRLARRESVVQQPELPPGNKSAGTLTAHSAALGELSRDHHAALVRFVAGRIGSIEDAKEIVQEAYTKLLTLERPGAISVLVGYLWRVAINLAIDRKRRDARVERFRQIALLQVETHEFSAESIVEAKERLAIVERAIARLPPRCLEAFALHVLQGRTFDQVAREMSISGRMAKKHVARALEYLQKCLVAADARSGPGE